MHLRAAIVLLSFGFIASGRAAAVERPNVLFIALDDLAPELGCYGKPYIISPHIDRLAARGVVFNRAYCQVAICNASRASLLTGLRPDATGVYDLTVHFRKKVPDVITLPQHFKQHGYHTQAFGKIFHEAFAGNAVPGRPFLDDLPSWSVPPWRGDPRYYFTARGVEEARKAYGLVTGKKGAELDRWTEILVRGLATEAPDVPDNVLADGKMTDLALVALRELRHEQRAVPPGERTPFFLGVGYLKPHMPFVAPKKYWDLYDRSKIPLAARNAPPEDAPPIALQVSWNEARAQSDVPKTGSISPEQARELRHGYYACVSFVDAQIGRLLDELDRLGLAASTAVVLWGDHGFSLGEHSIWGKLTNYEHSTRSPLIVSAPGARAKGRHSDALVEFVDIYPTLCELAGLPLPAHLEGTSFAPLLDDPRRKWKPAAFSQYLRPARAVYNVVPLAIPNPPGYDRYPREDTMGYTMRTDRHRFTMWQSAKNPDHVLAVELYDHRTDPAENVNLAGRAENAGLVRELTAQLRRGWRAAQPGQ